MLMVKNDFFQNFLMTVTSHPGISSFMSGPQRKAVPDAEYIKKLNAIYD